MLAQRLRRWANIERSLIQRVPLYRVPLYLFDRCLISADCSPVCVQTGDSLVNN